MILLIDAYNVLKQALLSDRINEKQRNKFISHLGTYLKRRQHKGILVFDGGPYDRATKEKVSGVYVVYSGAVESADDYIKRYLKKNKSFDILLVSSDRELRGIALRYKIESMPSDQFYKILYDFIKQHSHHQLEESETIKTTSKNNPELDDIMREGSKKVQSKVEDFVSLATSRKSKAHKLSKKDRAKIKKIKKL